MLPPPPVTCRLNITAADICHSPPVLLTLTLLLLLLLLLKSVEFDDDVALLLSFAGLVMRPHEP